MPKQAQCPECNQWSDVEWEAFVYWWYDSAECPKCKAIVLVESECNFREVDDHE
jgi:hypothetical protein